MQLQPTCDPDVFIEDWRTGYVRYVNTATGRRWEVNGACDRRANCLVGAVIDGETVTTIERARELAISYTGLDCPVTPEFSGCCSFTYTELDPANGN